MQKELVSLLSKLEPQDIEDMTLDLYEFYFNFIALRYKDYVDAPHIKELADLLMRLYLNENSKHLCVSIPPRHSKSSIMTIAFPLWLIFHDPDMKILIVNAEASLSENFGIRLREFVNDYGEIFDVRVSDVKHSSTHLKFEDSKGRLYKGSIRLTGASGSITGQDADILVLDDVYKGFSDISPTLLDKKIEWYKTMILQRKEPDTKLMILHTRWASNDLIGYLQEHSPDKYEFFSYPAIKEDGSPLWAERYTVEFLQAQLEEMGERLFSCIFQQKPLDETGSFFNINNITFHDEPFETAGKTLRVCRSWDLAFSDESKGQINDSTAGVLMFRTQADEFVITDIQHGQYGEGLKEKLKSVANADGTNTAILIESGTVGGASKFLFQEYQSYLRGFVTYQSEPIGSKVDRAYPFRQAILDGKIHVHLTNPTVRGEFIKQLRGFPLMAKHDDIIDACAYAFNWLNKYGAGSLVKASSIRLGGKRNERRRRNKALRGNPLLRF